MGIFDNCSTALMGNSEVIITTAPLYWRSHFRKTTQGLRGLYVGKQKIDLSPASTVSVSSAQRNCQAYLTQYSKSLDNHHDLSPEEHTHDSNKLHRHPCYHR
ncbi:hypothetical protein WICPIJ_003408 [Wickerhamomyces pijperi]|uniref:Uncharacterized protein n=1 Tax=Wickerhamomyces pijperi TaxID=599730 RepID=A0A9P8TN12_WICPI|nr:hypothetical protein WICPIJ_003408 [Wickerhamomyces pijperi]